ncbi:MAG: ExbD/TolR family protein [Zwartia sp.]|jgi:biopolymer transport protein ExbD
MRFRTPDHEPLEINLIPLIDVLLVMLIFLAATTTFMRQQALSITLPQASAQTQPLQAIELSIHESGRFAVNTVLIERPDIASLAQALRQASEGQQEPTVLIRAGANAAHQLVVTGMQAARQAGIARVHFATQAGE